MILLQFNTSIYYNYYNIFTIYYNIILQNKTNDRIQIDLQMIVYKKIGNIFCFVKNKYYQS